MNKQTEGYKALEKFYKDERKRQDEQWKKDNEAEANKRRLEEQNKL